MSINGIGFDLRTVRSRDDGIVRKILFGEDGILYGCDISYSGLNLTIQPGWFVSCGRLLRIDDPVVINVQTSGNTYCRVRFWINLSIAPSNAVFTQGGFEWDISATEVFDDLVQNDIYGGSTVYEIEFCVLQITGGVMTSVTRKLGKLAGGRQSLFVDGLALPTAGYSGSGPYTREMVITGLKTDAEKRYILFPQWTDMYALEIQHLAWGLLQDYRVTAENVLTITVKNVPVTPVLFSVKEVL